MTFTAIRHGTRALASQTKTNAIFVHSVDLKLRSDCQTT